MKRLNLSKCAALRDDDLKSILTTNIEWLDIQDCPLLEPEPSFKHIYRSSPNIEVLYLPNWIPGNSFIRIRLSFFSPSFFSFCRFLLLKLKQREKGEKEELTLLFFFCFSSSFFLFCICLSAFGFRVISSFSLFFFFSQCSSFFHWLLSWFPETSKVKKVTYFSILLERLFRSG